MEGEINNLILVWSTVVASLCYCHTAGKIFPSGIRRRLAISPIICLFFVLPLRFTSVHFSGINSFFISWLTNFKLMLFAFNNGPLYSNPPLPLSHFISMACFPIKEFKISQDHEASPKKIITEKSNLNFATKLIILALVIRAYDYKKHMHPNLMMFFYCLHLTIVLEMLLELSRAVAKTLVGVELEPQFNEPYLATSLHDFWGRRWNLMVTKLLHPTVYQPIRSVSARFTGRKWAPIPATLATFFVSGLMHELILYDMGRLRPSGEMMGFFILHGVSLSFEIIVKKMLNGRFRVPRIVSGPLTVVYVMYTSFLLFFPPFLRAEVDVKACTETLAFVEFVKTHRLASANEISCPFISI